MDELVARRAEELFAEDADRITRRADRTFACLMAAQWVFGVLLAVWFSPRAWAGLESRVHLHVYAAVFLGGLISSLPAFLAVVHPGRPSTRFTVAVGQMLTSALLIHLTGGRIETHFHVFGSLAFLAFYRDWRVIVAAAAVVAIDHGVRGVFWPQSVYGVSMIQSWRFLEHTGWVVFESAFLCYSIRMSVREMREAALSRAGLEEANKGIEAKVERRTRELAETNRKLQESEKLRGEFLANVSHELRTPLTLTIAPVESLLGGDCGKLTPSQSDLLRSVHNNSIRLLQMVSGLLDFSKLEAGKFKVNREPTPAAALSRSIFSDFQPLMSQRGLTGRLSDATGGAVLELDRYLYEKILFNLLSNAVKFTPAGGSVSVSLALDGDRLAVSVCDTGIGISPADVPRLFQKFSQLEGSSTRKFEGTGLGLALVKEFAELLDGGVSIKSEPGAGSTFLVTCRAPRSQADVSASGLVRRAWNPVVRDQPAASHAPDRGLSRVLIAEDNADLGAYIAGLLAPFCDTRVVRDGESALRAAREWAPEIVLSDVMMPERDGLSLCRELKSSPDTAGISVILLTAQTHRDALLKGWDAGADEYLYKPFHPKELVTRIRSMLANINALRETARDLARSNADLEQFAYAASHDLQEPLRKVTSFTQLLARNYADRLDADANSFIAHAVDGATRMSALIESLLRYSRAGARSKPPVRTDCADVLKGVLEDLELRVKETGGVVSVGAMPVVLADPMGLAHVFQNLVGNALKFRGADPPEVRITAEKQGREWVFSVRDNGIGISPDYAGQLFTLFKRLHARSKYPGTGIGLAICKKIVESHRGRIWLVPKEGPGAEFRFTIPS